MPAPDHPAKHRQHVRLERANRANAARPKAHGGASHRFPSPALIMMIYAMAYVIYVPVGPVQVLNELIHGRTSPEMLSKIWTGIRYVAALTFAPALLMARGARPLARCWPVLPFLIFAATSVAWSSFPKESMRYTLNLFTTIVATSALVNRWGLAGFGRRVQIVVGILIITSLVISILVPSLGVHQAYDLDEPMHAGKWRGLFGHKNLLGGMSVISLIYGLRSTRHETLLWKLFFIIVQICSAVCLFKAKSAGAVGGALLAGTFFLLMKHRATAHPLSIVAMMLIGFALAQALSLNPTRLAEFLGRDSTFTGRATLWALGRPMIESHLFFGSGLGADTSYFGGLSARQVSASSAWNLHSGYLDLLFNLGLVGAVLLILAILSALLRGYAFTRTHSGDERDQAVIFMALVVAACAIAAIEIYPFADYGVIGVWTALPALYQLDSRGRMGRQGFRHRVVRGAPGSQRQVSRPRPVCRATS